MASICGRGTRRGSIWISEIIAALVSTSKAETIADALTAPFAGGHAIERRLQRQPTGDAHADNIQCVGQADLDMVIDRLKVRPDPGSASGAGFDPELFLLLFF